MMATVSSRLVFTVLYLFLVGSRADEATAAWKGWKCDDMTPNLCGDLRVTTGHVETQKGIKIKYWRYHSDGSKLPIVVSNGGPGLPHNYVLPLKQLACRGHDVIFYDQGGVGKSALPANKTVQDYLFLLDISYYAETELPALISALEIDNFHLVADSWGTMLALHFALNSVSSARNNLISMILNGPVPNIVELIERQWDPETGTIGRMPTYFQERLRAIDKAGDYDSPELEAMDEIIKIEFYSRNGVFSDCVQQMLEGMNLVIYVGMWGPADYFNLTGTLKDFNVSPRLKELEELPILLTSGEFDIVRPATLMEMHDELKLSEAIEFKGSGHVSVLDVPGPLTLAIDDFTSRVEFSLDGKSPFDPISVTDGLLAMEQKPDPRVGGVVAIGIAAVAAAFVMGFVAAKRGRHNVGYQDIV